MSEGITDDEVAVHTGSGTQRDGVIFRASTVISIQLLLSEEEGGGGSLKLWI